MAATAVIIPAIYSGPDNLDQLYCSEKIITVEVEKQLLQLLEKEEWTTAGHTSTSRKVIHFGRKYNYVTRRDDGDSSAPPFPAYLQGIADHLVQAGVIPRIEQCIINAYEPGQGINAHTDIDSYGDIIISLALGEDTNFIFRNKETGQEIHAYHPRRSLLVMGGIYRHNYTHEIKNLVNVTKPDGSKVRKLNTRVSLTFRYMKKKNN